MEDKTAMKIKKQFIGKDKNGNLQLIVKTKSNKYFLLDYTNMLGFSEITKKVFKEHLNRV